MLYKAAAGFVSKIVWPERPGKVGLGHRLASMILEVFSNLNDFVILQLFDQQANRKYLQYRRLYLQAKWLMKKALSRKRC